MPIFCESDIDASSTPLIMDMLSAKLYDRPHYAVLREYISNGIDSARARAQRTGLPYVPVQVHIDDYRLSFRDHGDGLDVDGLRGVFTFGRSTKREDTISFGQFGLGAKAAYALVDSFLVRSYQGDHMLVAAASREPGQAPQLIISDPAPGDGTTGVEVELTLTHGDREQLVTDLTNIMRALDPTLVRVYIDGKKVSLSAPHLLVVSGGVRVTEHLYLIKRPTPITTDEVSIGGFLYQVEPADKHRNLRALRTFRSDPTGEGRADDPLRGLRLVPVLPASGTVPEAGMTTALEYGPSRERALPISAPNVAEAYAQLDALVGRELADFLHVEKIAEGLDNPVYKYLLNRLMHGEKSTIRDADMVPFTIPWGLIRMNPLAIAVDPEREQHFYIRTLIADREKFIWCRPGTGIPKRGIPTLLKEYNRSIAVLPEGITETALDALGIEPWDQETLRRRIEDVLSDRKCGKASNGVKVSLLASGVTEEGVSYGPANALARLNHLIDLLDVNPDDVMLVGERGRSSLPFWTLPVAAKKAETLRGYRDGIVAVHPTTRSPGRALQDMASYVGDSAVLVHWDEGTRVLAKRLPAYAKVNKRGDQRTRDRVQERVDQWEAERNGAFVLCSLDANARALFPYLTEWLTEHECTDEQELSSFISSALNGATIPSLIFSTRVTLPARVLALPENMRSGIKYGLSAGAVVPSRQYENHGTTFLPVIGLREAAQWEGVLAQGADITMCVTVPPSPLRG